MILNIHEPYVKVKPIVCLNSLDESVNFTFMSELTAFDRINLVLTERGIKTPDFQRKLDIKSQHWTNWRTRGVPAKRLFDIADALGVTVNWLNSGKDPKYTNTFNEHLWFFNGMPVREESKEAEPVKQDINDYLIELCNVCDDMIDHQKLFPDECRLWLYKEARAMAKKHNLPTMEKLELLLLEMAEEKDKH